MNIMPIYNYINIMNININKIYTTFLYYKILLHF